MPITNYLIIIVLKSSISLIVFFLLMTLDCTHLGIGSYVSLEVNRASRVSTSGKHRITAHNGRSLGKYDDGQIYDNHDRLVGHASVTHCSCGLAELSYFGVDGRRVVYEHELFIGHDQSLRTSDPSVRRRHMRRGGPSTRVVISDSDEVLEYDPSIENPYVSQSDWFKDLTKQFMRDYGLSEEAAIAHILALFK